MKRSFLFLLTLSLWLYLLPPCATRPVAAFQGTRFSRQKLASRIPEPLSWRNAWRGMPAAFQGYRYSRTLTIDHTKCGSADSSNFPVLFSGTYAYLATTANGGNVTNSSGYDIIFTSDAAGATQIAHEIETYTAATGAVNFHFKLGTCSASTDQVVYLWYSNPAITTSQESITSVWDSNYKAVWHLPNGSSLTLTDSTSNANTLTNNNTATATTGQIDGGVALSNPSSQYLSVADNAGLSPTAALTVEGWFNQTALTLNRTLIAKWNYSTQGTWAIQTGTGTNTQLLFFIADALNEAGNNFGNTATSTWSTGWHHLVMVYDGSGSGNSGRLKVYQDGSAMTLGFGGTIPAALQDSTAEVRVGDFQNLSRFWNGSTDEVRISNSARSASWATASYNSQSSPSTFYTLGSAVDNYVGSRRVIIQ